jgi:hypothetical protein
MNSARAQNTRALVIRPRGERGRSYHGGWTGAAVARSESYVGVTVTHACNWGQIRTQLSYRTNGRAVYLVRGCSLPAKGHTKRSLPGMKARETATGELFEFVTLSSRGFATL